MINVIKNNVYLVDGKEIIEYNGSSANDFNNILKSQGLNNNISENDFKSAQKNTISNSILNSHNKSGDSKNLKIKFDALASHDITYVGVIQTARASGLDKFPVPYVLTNCHNSLCAVGGTINEDDHVFGLSAAKKYGGIFVPAHLAVIHQYMREMFAGCGKMILGSDSHTRYGAIGTMAIGEGGPEIVKQLLNNTYDIEYPDTILVYLKNKPKRGVGPQDIALAIIGKVFSDGFVKNKILEFCGDGIKNLSMDFRNGIDVMTTETTCLSSIWETDEKTEHYLKIHGRQDDYRKLSPGKIACYSGAIVIDMEKIEPMIALPFHPSNVYSIKELIENPYDILHNCEIEGKKQFDNNEIEFKLTDKITNGKIQVDQGIIAGCAGGMYENIYEAAMILDGQSTGDSYFGLSIYPSSQPVNIALTNNGAMSKLMQCGAVIRTAFCGPCFGAGDVPSNNGLSIRHATRNFPNREGSKPSSGQISSVALMDARSIAATALNKGILTPATEIDYYNTENSNIIPAYEFDKKVYEKRVYNGFNNNDINAELKFGPDIANWPKMYHLNDNMLLKIVTVIKDPVTTTDELIPSGETSSYRSNPYKLAEFTLSRKDPNYVSAAKKVRTLEENRQAGSFDNEIIETIKKFGESEEILKNTTIGSAIFANKPGDGSAREQAASCQKVLGGAANISIEYATKRYRSNLINWGILPFTYGDGNSNDLNQFEYAKGDYIFIKGIKSAVENGIEELTGMVLEKDGSKEIKLYLKNLNSDERDVLLSGSLINYYGRNK